MIGETGSGVVGESGGAGTEVGDGRKEGIRAIFTFEIPAAFFHPRDFVTIADIDGVAKVAEVLVAAMPAGISTFDHVNDAGLVAHVRIVID